MIRRIKIIAGTIADFYDWLKFKSRLREMDREWSFMGGNCFGMFPPSFYYTHTEEEIRRISKEKLDELRALCDKYNQDNP